jgi:hypothetical protein
MPDAPKREPSAGGRGEADGFTTEAQRSQRRRRIGPKIRPHGYHGDPGRIRIPPRCGESLSHGNHQQQGCFARPQTSVSLAYPAGGVNAQNSPWQAPGGACVPTVATVLRWTAYGKTPRLGARPNPFIPEERWTESTLPRSPHHRSLLFAPSRLRAVPFHGAKNICDILGFCETYRPCEASCMKTGNSEDGPSCVPSGLGPTSIFLGLCPSPRHFSHDANGMAGTTPREGGFECAGSLRRADRGHWLKRSSHPGKPVV